MTAGRHVIRAFFYHAVRFKEDKMATTQTQNQTRGNRDFDTRYDDDRGYANNESGSRAFWATLLTLVVLGLFGYLAYAYYNTPDENAAYTTSTDAMVGAEGAANTGAPATEYNSTVTETSPNAGVTSGYDAGTTQDNAGAATGATNNVVTD
jgi:hypothetical protein